MFAITLSATDTKRCKSVDVGGSTKDAWILQFAQGKSAVKVVGLFGFGLKINVLLFLNSHLQHRLTRGRSRSRDRGRQSPSSGVLPHEVYGSLEHRDSTDYAASSEQSSSAVTPLTQSPRHRARTIGDSPLARRADLQYTNTRGSNERLHKSQLSVDQGAGEVAYTIATTAQLEFLQCDETKKRREIALRQHAFYELRIRLICGTNLVAMDKTGTSDPYVKFKLGSNRLLYKSKTVHRNLNPTWDETFVVAIEDPFQPIHMKVFDYDWGLQDDFMGCGQLDLTTLELNQCTDIVVKLIDPSAPGRELGELTLSATLWPRTQEDKEQVRENEKHFSVRLLITD